MKNYNYIVIALLTGLLFSPILSTNPAQSQLSELSIHPSHEIYKHEYNSEIIEYLQRHPELTRNALQRRIASNRIHPSHKGHRKNYNL